ncbi:MAG: sodium/hydrogen antiporter [Saprospiraceae bacterium]|nr:MAG: sodium/hydrogen antiporter [Saprospiraceae bacterium]
MFELAGIVVLGILSQWVAWRTRVPAILPLIVAGLMVGPLSTLWTSDGTKLIEPVFEPTRGTGLFPNEYLYHFVSLAIGIILFEGGLTLKRKELKTIGPTVAKLLLFGTFVTLIGGGIAARYLLDMSWQVALQFSALIIVTGPTVIAPILRNVPLNLSLSNILKWESIIIDPIGATVAVLVFEFIQSGGSVGDFTSHAFFGFLQVVLSGVALGVIAAFGLYYLIRKEWVPLYLLNVFTLSVVLAVFVFSDTVANESGLLTVVVMGMMLGNLDVPHFRDVLVFKESVSILLISILFILLAAQMDLEDLTLVADLRSLFLFAIVVLVLRPVAVFLSAWKSELTTKEKIFVSWIGPRGIVAAGVASLFGYKLQEQGVAGAEYITPGVFMVVLGTVVLNASTARPLAFLLGVTQEASKGILIVGADRAARVIAAYLKASGRHVVLVDNNADNIAKAKRMGLEAYQINIYTEDLEQHIELLDIGYLIAMTANQDVNNFVVKKYRDVFGELGTFRLLTPEELKLPPSQLPAQGIFSYTDDYLNLNEVARDNPAIHEIPIRSVEHLTQLMELMKTSVRVPLFIKHPDGFLDVIPREIEHLPLDEGGYYLVYMGDALPEEVRSFN